MDINLSQNQSVRKSYWHWEQKPPTSLPRRRPRWKVQNLQSGCLVSRAQGPNQSLSTGWNRVSSTHQEREQSCLPSVKPGWRNMLWKPKVEGSALHPPQCLCLRHGCTRQPCLDESKPLLKTLTSVLKLRKTYRPNKQSNKTQDKILKRQNQLQNHPM